MLRARPGPGCVVAGGSALARGGGIGVRGTDLAGVRPPPPGWACAAPRPARHSPGESDETGPSEGGRGRVRQGAARRRFRQGAARV